MEIYNMPTKIYHGQGSLLALNELDMKRVLIISDPFMVKSKRVEDITNILDSKEIEYLVFSDIIPDPTTEVVVEGIAQMQTINPDTVIAFGGGSAIDSAKAICEMYAQINSTEFPIFIAIPTTSGTGSEVTSFSVITDVETKSKYPLVKDSMLPDVAILDPAFTATVPATITADTGMDVLTHSLEAIVSTKSSDFTDACAEKASRIIWNNLVDVYQDGEDLEKRAIVHNASCLAGIAFNGASLGICHSLAHAMGARFHVPHGRANAMLLPYVITYNAGLELPSESDALRKYADVARLLGVQSVTDKATVHGFISGIYRMMKKMNMPTSIKDYGLNEEEFLEAIPDMAQRALEDNCTITNPRVPSVEDLEDIYRCLCRGRS
ncbi:Alcohol dehydrogenase, class IV [Granulicatella balaenopterae]|uniref:Alcohol dehydrogenase, class IV n=1 Tax=Granulicatella balaenopterae TaxID=137733 RepID=A0A1H9HBG5_9LACT|nr:1-propanol dehydrogenase PduQ [Granulicatella balaenopterae]SEQ59643.1 Alcohol dehydrogenase, class IV [Granulicatella balaenopterae]